MTTHPMTPTPARPQEAEAIRKLREYLNDGGHRSGAPTPDALAPALDLLDANMTHILAAYDAVTERSERLAAERDKAVADASEWAGKAQTYHEYGEQMERERDFLVTEYERAVRCKPEGFAHAAAHLYNAIVNGRTWEKTADVLSKQLDALAAERDALRADKERIAFIQRWPGAVQASYADGWTVYHRTGTPARQQSFHSGLFTDFAKAVDYAREQYAELDKARQP